MPKYYSNMSSLEVTIVVFANTALALLVAFRLPQMLNNTSFELPGIADTSGGINFVNDISRAIVFVASGYLLRLLFGRLSRSNKKAAVLLATVAILVSVAFALNGVAKLNLKFW